MLEILRLSHRIARDKRISTHIALTSRAFLADNMYYSGEKDSSLESSIERINKKFGSKFSIEYVKDPIRLVKEKKAKGCTIIHLTVYGLELKTELPRIKSLKNILIIIGSEHVPFDFYKLADINLAITNQPHSELSALAILLYELQQGKQLAYTDALLTIKPCKLGKLIKQAI
ncbi:MAG TPA: tRNA (cytidine(56)-2'-O)-methyltransferase [Candidatus Nanoarchaeia archaeon]|nr:tRNA (cytidine(56)-2'-O)-methyltransferase [Candidatus Nanoarchaeia archaeon]